MAVLVWLNPCQTVINVVSQFQRRRLSDFIKNREFIFQQISKEVLHLQLLVGQPSQWSHSESYIAICALSLCVMQTWPCKQRLHAHEV